MLFAMNPHGGNLVGMARLARAKGPGLSRLAVLFALTPHARQKSARQESHLHLTASETVASAVGLRAGMAPSDGIAPSLDGSEPSVQGFHTTRELVRHTGLAPILDAL